VTTRIVIVGAGGFGREVLSWLRTSPEWRRRHDVESIVFIDDGIPDVPVPVDVPVVSTITDFIPGPDDLAICSVGSPSVRKNIVRELEQRGLPFAVFIHDRALVQDNTKLKPGVVVCPGVIVTTHVSLGSHVHLNINSTVGHDAVIGDFVTLSPGCHLGGFARIEDDVFLGTAAVVLPGKIVARGAVVGAGAVVVRDVSPELTVVGNPARPMIKK
jgi:sugar O-acyltransferase (sialic acid O-acetyltransferase NeuD family)